MTGPTLHLGAVLYLRDDPLKGADAIAWTPRGALLVADGHVLAVGREDAIAAPPNAPVIRHEGVIIPGLIDAHVHFPQTDMIAAYGARLLDWLETYTFPAETAFADRSHADRVAAFFLEELLRHGVTTVAVFATSHVDSVDALFAAAETRGMRIIAGKVLMDRHAPSALLDVEGGGVAETRALIERWHGRGRLLYAVTPRFALTSSPGQLAAAGQLLAERPDVYLQTHLAENEEECGEALSRHPGAADYLAIYERYGMVRPRSIFAHCIHLDEDAFSRLARAGAAAAFCPSSNLFLGSGMFDLAAARRAGTAVALATDVGAGTSFSMLATMGEAYKVCQARRTSLDAFSAFYLATLGAARALGLEGRIGDLAPGSEADFAVLDPAATPLLARRSAAARTLHEMLFALMFMGDDRAISETWVGGRRAHARATASEGRVHWRGEWTNKII